jgi:hypothetical protein
MTFDQKIQIANTVGTWLAGIGTVAAVITSLWFSRRENKIKLAVKVSHSQIITRGQQSTPDCLFIHAVNTGVRPANITGFGWFVGRFKNKQHFVQLLGDSGSDAVPKMLNEGEEGNFFIRLARDENPTGWIDKFIADVLQPNPRKQIKTLRLMAYTSVGQNFKAKIDSNLKKLFVQEFKANK